MGLLIGDEAPNFEAETTEGKINFHDYIDGSWAVLFSHPKNFTPVCTTELGFTAKLKPEFDKRGVKVLGLSVDPIEDHRAWVGDIEETQGTALNFPLIADPEGEDRAFCVCDWARQKDQIEDRISCIDGPELQ